MSKDPDDDLNRELQSHLELEAEELRDRGFTPDAARHAAHRAFGSVARTAEDTRAVTKWMFVARLLQDVRYAIRTMRRTPGFTAVAVLSLALGIGANTAIFTFVSAALLKPLPYPNADRIVAITQHSPKVPGATRVPPRVYLPWRDRATSFEALTIAQPIPVNTQGIDGAEQIAGLWSTSELFQVFGATPLIGRLPSEGDEAAGESSVVVLSHGYWQRRYGADPSVIGQTMSLGGNSARIIAVLPAGFRVGTLAVDVYMPLPLDRNKPDAVGSRSFECFGLLKPGVSVDSARAELAVIAEQTATQNRLDIGWDVSVLPLHDYLVKDNRLTLLVLSAVVVFVLMIACANLAGLLLTRGAGRRGELALRASLGAGRGRLIQQLLVESLVLSAAGGALGLLLGVWASRALVFLAKDAVSFGQMADVRFDATVLAFAAGVSLLSAIVFGLVPAWRTSRLDLQTPLREQGRGAGETRAQQKLRSGLVVGEVALAVVLLAGAGLLLRTFSQLLQVRLGFDTEQVLTMRMLVTGEPVRRASLVESMLDRVEALPEVRAAGTIQFLPLGGHTNNGPFRFVGRPADSNRMESDVSTVSRGYFAAMGIPVLRGRPFGRQDQIATPRVALVNQAFVNKYSPREDPLGLVIIGDWANPKPTEIIGVVGDIRHNGLTKEPNPTVFLAQAQVPGYITYFVLRTTADAQQLAAAIRREVRQLDPNQPVTTIQSMDQYVSTAIAKPRLYAVLLGTFAALALVLAAIGLYGLMAYAVTRRTHEIGIRMALGAQPAEVLRATLSQGIRLTALGLAIGLVGALVLRRFVVNLLYGVTAEDLSTYGGVALVLGIVAIIAAYLPARRASRVDPMVALKYQ
jgi:putative ABC transport system permease protein